MMTETVDTKNLSKFISEAVFAKFHWWSDFMDTHARISGRGYRAAVSVPWTASVISTALHEAYSGSK